MQQSDSPDNIPLREKLTYPPGVIVEKYPYDEWFDGDVWRLKMYEDFYVHPSSMQSALYQAARKRGLKVRVHMPITEDCLYVQATKKITKNR
jgi:urease alpha subunit